MIRQGEYVFETRDGDIDFSGAPRLAGKAATLGPAIVEYRLQHYVASHDPILILLPTTDNGELHLSSFNDGTAFSRDTDAVVFLPYVLIKQTIDQMVKEAELSV